MRLIDADRINFYKANLSRGILRFDDVEIAEKEQIDRMPTIDPESLRPHGKWKVTHTPTENAVCQNCGIHFQAYYAQYPYCPRCGAKMDGGENA